MLSLFRFANYGKKALYPQENRGTIEQYPAIGRKKNKEKETNVT